MDWKSQNQQTKFSRKNRQDSKRRKRKTRHYAVGASAGNLATQKKSPEQIYETPKRREEFSSKLRQEKSAASRETPWRRLPLNQGEKMRFS